MAIKRISMASALVFSRPPIASMRAGTRAGVHLGGELNGHLEKERGHTSSHSQSDPQIREEQRGPSPWLLHSCPRPARRVAGLGNVRAEEERNGAARTRILEDGRISIESLDVLALKLLVRLVAHPPDTRLHAIGQRHAPGRLHGVRLSHCVNRNEKK